MPRGQERVITGVQIDPYVQQSMQQSRQQAENRLLTAMRERGATERTQISEAGATQRVGIQAATARAGMAAEAELADKRAAEAEIARREDLEYRKTNDTANRALQKAIADQNIELRRAEMQQDIDLAEKATNLQLDLVEIDIAHKIQQGNADRNMIHSLFKTAQNQEMTKQKLITNYTQAKNKTDQDKNLHSLTVTNVGDRLRDDPKMRLTPEIRAAETIKIQALEGIGPIEAVQKQITLEQSKIQLEDLLPENRHKIVKQLSEGTMSFMDIRGAWSVIEGALPVFSERVKDAEDAGNKEGAKYWRWQRLRLNNMKVSIQGLMDDKTSITDQRNVTVGSVARDALGPILDLDMGSAVNNMLNSGVDYDTMFDTWTKSMEPYPELVVPGLRTKEAQSHLENINSLIVNRGQGVF